MELENNLIENNITNKQLIEFFINKLNLEIEDEERIEIEIIINNILINFNITKEENIDELIKFIKRISNLKNNTNKRLRDIYEKNRNISKICDLFASRLFEYQKNIGATGIISDFHDLIDIINNQEIDKFTFDELNNAIYDFGPSKTPEVVQEYIREYWDYKQICKFSENRSPYDFVERLNYY